MNLLGDIITYIRRIIKSPSNAQITDDLLIDYINRFWIMDVDARIQLFDLKTKYQFQTIPGYDQYNMPLYGLQYEGITEQEISYYPVYQGFVGPAYINGIQVPLQTEKQFFFNMYPNIVQEMNVIGCGNGTAGPYDLRFPIGPSNQLHPLNIPLQYILRGHIDITGIIDFANEFSILQDPPLITETQINANLPFIQTVPVSSAIPAVYITSIGSDGSSIVICDSGQFMADNQSLGLLMQQGPFPNGNLPLPNSYLSSFTITGITTGSPTMIDAINTLSVGQIVEIDGVVGTTELNGNSYKVIAVTGTTVTIDATTTNAWISGGTISSIQNVINYLTGHAHNVFFPKTIPMGAQINAQCYLFQTGLPRTMLYYNNTITLRSPPDQQYLVEIDAYLSPAAYMNTSQATQFAYMAEYIARGAARKILADTGDWEQFDRYEPLFREQEMLVWKRSQRQFTESRTQTIYSQGINQGQSGFNNIGGSTI